MSRPVIEINDRFRMKSRDNYGWELHDVSYVTNRKGESVEAVRITYHPTLIKICDEVIERSTTVVEDLRDVIAAISKAHDDLEETLQKGFKDANIHRR